jgi:hypothetical protein
MLSACEGRARRRSWGVPLIVGVVAGGGLASRPAAAQTWSSGQTTPRLHEIVAIDRTGEALWPYGAEDVAGDGLERFEQEEQSIDLRTAYASADAERLWARAYVSASAEMNAIGGGVTVFLFIDADRSALTGGKAAAPEIDARFTTDSSPGGYEFVVGLRGDGTVSQLWAWKAAPAPGQYEVVMAQPGQAVAEAGQDLAPRHGYVQGTIDLGLLGLTSACEASLYLRSVNDTASLGAGDLEIDRVAPCVPADANDDGVPDVIVPPSGCTDDSGCPGKGLCVDGACILPAPCAVDADCKPDSACSADGRCVPRPSGTCTTGADCGDLICASGQCGACTPGGSDCGADRRCAPTGRCVPGAGPGGGGSSGGGAGGDGLGLASGEEVRGGACACAALPTPERRDAEALLAVAGFALCVRRQRRASRQQP